MPDLKMKVSCLEVKFFYFSAIIEPIAALSKNKVGITRRKNCQATH